MATLAQGGVQELTSAVARPAPKPSPPRRPVDPRHAFRALRTLGRGLDVLFPDYCEVEIKRARDAGWHIDRPDCYCPRCGETAPPAGRTERGCPACVGESLPWDRVIRLAAYGQPMDRWVRTLKFFRGWGWGRWLGEQLAAVADEGRRTVVCPVPMHYFHRWKRGYNQAHLIADAFARTRRLPLVPLLRRPKRSQPQVGLAFSQRVANVRGAFTARAIDLSGWDVWLIDDVKTTGSTLAACARLLRAAGAERVHIAVAAVADPKHHKAEGV